ncbi:hypothetical protein ACIQPT_22185 [Streptomyces sp. NPDC091289]|uniref:hypothetical protein n=1 Tax=Streptomyces sp. NPDC091289 TaxID=3365989 RepID=UPI0037F37E6B
MSTTTPQPGHSAKKSPTPRKAPTTDRARFWSGLCAGLFVPAALFAVLLTLSSDRAGRCLTYGDLCGDSLPGWLFGWSLALAVIACVVALTATAVRVRQAAFGTQLLAEFVALTVILSYT